jgi:hypothetical protein
MFVCCVCFVLSGRGLCDGLINRIWCNWLNVSKTCGQVGYIIEFSDFLKRNNFCEILDFSQIRCWICVASGDKTPWVRQVASDVSKGPSALTFKLNCHAPEGCHSRNKYLFAEQWYWRWRTRKTMRHRVKADSHIACRANAVPKTCPCHVHAVPMPCSDHAVLLKATTQHGRQETACGLPVRVRLLPATTRSSTKIVIRSILISPSTIHTYDCKQW